MRLVHHLCVAVLPLALAACSRSNAPTPVTASTQTASAEAESTVGNATVHVSAVPTTQLPPSVAQGYGIERAPRRILLLVNLRDIGAGPAPAVTATVTDLQEHTTPVDLRAIHVAGGDASTVDYVGTVDATLPDTLRFQVVVRNAGTTASVQLSRDFYPE